MNKDAEKSEEIAPDSLRFTWQELSGSLGDVGLFLSLTLVMALTCGFDFGVILICAGLMNVFTGWWFRQPIPVQPMKAIAAVAITEGLTRGDVTAAGILMGAFLMAAALLGGAVNRLGGVIPRAVVRGIQFGVGLKLTLKGAQWLAPLPAAGWDSLATAALVLVVLVTFRTSRLPVLLFVFLAGFALLAAEAPEAYRAVTFTGPAFHFMWPNWDEWHTGLMRGAVPQLPLTLLNSVVAVCALSADYFPGRGIEPRRMAASIGAMNLLCVPIGSIPFCHGSGGLAAQYRFGARTGASVIMLGALKVAAGLLFGGAMLQLLQFYPLAVLGPMLMLAGVELARAARDMTRARDVAIVLITGALIIGTNTLIGFLAGVAASLAIAAAAKMKRWQKGSARNAAERT